LAARLVQTAGTVQKDDLSLLAKMHGWCDALLQAGDALAQAGAVETATALSRLLEALILNEVPDADAALTETVATTMCLGEQLGVSASDAPPCPTPKASGGTGKAKVQPEAQGVVAAPAGASASAESPRLPVAATPGAEAPQPLTAGPERDAAQFAELAVTSPAPAEEAVIEAVGESPSPAARTETPYEQTPLRIDPKEQEFVLAFTEEAREHIEAIEAALLEVEREPGNTKRIDDLFRPFHTIKGMAGFLNLRDVNCLTHEVETLLDQGRKGKRTVTPGLIDLVFSVVDIVKAQVAAVAAHLAEPKGEVVPQPPVAQMIERLRDVVAGRAELSARAEEAGSAALRVGENLVEQGAVAQEVVDFALQMQAQGATPQKTGELLVEMGAVTAKQVDKAIRVQTQAAASPAAAPPATVASAKVGAAATPAAAPVEQSIRIDTAKLDALVDMVGELVIAQTLVSANPSVAQSQKLGKDVSQVTKIIRDVQETAMGMRMVPIGGTFQKMARLVRDVSRKAGKQVELTIAGEDTELDKNVIQQISDPLIHMVRNAVDHGVEAPEVRRAAGKPEVGRVHLAAFHHAGNIVIEISDDGKGLDPQVLVAKAMEKGMVQPGEELTEQQAFHLVFAAGFSTAAQVTDISGRGVGMDVVKRNIEQLRGKVEIASEKGEGSTFSIRLPLTLAIIDGMVVKVAEERFIIPTIGIEQALRPVPQQITSVQHRGDVLNVRGRLIPLVQLGALFRMTGRVDPCEAMVVIASSDAGPVGLVVEELIGQQQVVIKSLGARFEGLRGISGAAILGDGRVGLILETSGLAVHYHEMHLAQEKDATARNVRVTIPAPAAEQPAGGREETPSWTVDDSGADAAGSAGEPERQTELVGAGT